MYRSSTKSDPALSAIHTVAVPAGSLDGNTLVNGDTVVLLIFSDNGYPYVTAGTGLPSGFTMHATEAFVEGAGGRARYIRCATKYISNAAGEGTDGNYTIGLDFAEACWVKAIALSGRANTAPVVVDTNSGAAGASPVNASLTGLTAPSGADLIWGVTVGAATDNTASATTAPTSPIFTSRQSVNSLWRISNVSTRDNVSAGETGAIAGSVTFDSASNAPYAGLVIALAPLSDALAPSLTSGPTISNANASGFDIGGTADENCTASLVFTVVGASQPDDATFDASTETAAVTAGTPFSIHHFG